MADLDNTSEDGASPVASGILPAVTAAWTSATAANTALSLSTLNFCTIALSFNTSAGTLTGGVLTFEVSDDSGTTWYPIYLVQQETLASLTLSLSGQGGSAITWRGDVTGFTNFRVRLSTQITGTATVNLRLQSSALSCSPSTVIQNTGAHAYVALQDSNGNGVNVTGNALDVTGTVTANAGLASTITTGSTSSIGVTAVQIHSGSIVAITGVTIRSSTANTDLIYFGPSTVTANTTAATDGIPLKIGESITLPITNVNLVYGISPTAGQKVFWVVL